MATLVLLAVLLGTPLYQMPTEDVDTYIRHLAESNPSFSQRLTVIAQASLGTPYHDAPLGEGATGRFDQDPLIDLGRVDCVTYVEQGVALAASQTYAETVQKLQAIRYHRATINFEARNHFMISDWIQNNPWCRDVSTALDVPTVPDTRTISKRGFFDRVKVPSLGRQTPDRDVTIHYIPSAQVGEALQKLPSPSLIVFIGKVDWLFALHCGLYLKDDNAQGKLYHASSKGQQVVAVDLAAYLAENASRYIGFTAYKITSPNAKPTEEN